MATFSSSPLTAVHTLSLQLKVCTLASGLFFLHSINGVITSFLIGPSGLELDSRTLNKEHIWQGQVTNRSSATVCFFEFFPLVLVFPNSISCGDFVSFPSLPYFCVPLFLTSTRFIYQRTMQGSKK